MSSVIKGMEDYYAKRASLYEESMGYLNAQVLGNYSEIFDMFRRELQGKSVLELACGPGFWTWQVSQYANSVFAIDLNEETLIEAHKKKYPPIKLHF